MDKPGGLDEITQRKRERTEETLAWAGTLGVACLVLASLIGLVKRMRPAETEQPSGATAGLDARVNASDQTNTADGG
jgi:hypothetical protein